MFHGTDGSIERMLSEQTEAAKRAMNAAHYLPRWMDDEQGPAMQLAWAFAREAVDRSQKISDITAKIDRILKQLESVVPDSSLVGELSDTITLRSLEEVDLAALVAVQTVEHTDLEFLYRFATLWTGEGRDVTEPLLRMHRARHQQAQHTQAATKPATPTKA
jgi:hypothetical protein